MFNTETFHPLDIFSVFGKIAQQTKSKGAYSICYGRRHNDLQAEQEVTLKKDIY